MLLDLERTGIDENDGFLLDLLRELQKFMKIKNLVELSINGEGEIWLEVAGKGYYSVKAPFVNEQWAEGICRTLGQWNESGFSEEKPLISCTLPGGHRFYGIVGRTNVKSKIGISIRMARFIKVDAEDYGISDRTKSLSRVHQGEGYEHHRWESSHPTGSFNWLLDLIRQGAPILISGGTSTGKTTFLNNVILPNIPLENRIITVQDVDELRVPHKNKVELFVPRIKQEGLSQLSYNEIIDSTVRLNPTSVIMGEISVDNAFACARLLNTGETSFIATLHANNPLEALEAIRRNIDMSGHSSKSTVSMLVRNIAAIVQLKNHSEHGRIIEGIESPKDLPWRQIADETGNSEEVRRIREALESLAGMQS